MPPPPRPDRKLLAMRLMAGVCVALSLMCAGLAYAWKTERDEAACWRAAAQFQLVPSGDCRR